MQSNAALLLRSRARPCRHGMPGTIQPLDQSVAPLNARFRSRHGVVPAGRNTRFSIKAVSVFVLDEGGACITPRIVEDTPAMKENATDFAQVSVTSRSSKIDLVGANMRRGIAGRRAPSG